MRELIENYCSKIGKNTDFVQGAGGNVSWKENGTLWIKASGTWLSDAKDKDIFVPVDLAEVNQQIAIGNFDIKPKSENTNVGALRPSIETVLHAVMPHKVVSHTHLIDALVLLTQESAEDKLSKRLRSGLRWGIVPYAKPGPELGESVHNLLKDKALDIVFLSNHGVIVGGDNTNDVEQIYAALREDLNFEELKPMPSRLEIPDLTGIDDYRILEHAIHQGLAVDPSVYSLIDERWALYPDHVVFLGVNPSKFNSFNDFTAYLNRGSAKPDYAIIENTAVLVKDDISENKLAMLDLYYRVLKTNSHVKTYSALTMDDITSLLNWDAEKYRQQIAK